MSTIKLNQQLNRVEIKEFEIENPIVFNYFNNLSANDRDEKLLRTIYVGVLALTEDRIYAFLSKTSNELGTELESLKMIFEMKKELFLGYIFVLYRKDNLLIVDYQRLKELSSYIFRSIPVQKSGVVVNA